MTNIWDNSQSEGGIISVTLVTVDSRSKTLDTKIDIRLSKINIRLSNV